MIIKSMSRKAPTFGQLIDYIGRGAGAALPSDPQTGTVFARNRYHSGNDAQVVVGQCQSRVKKGPDRGVKLVH
jgi:hypothetical protein